MWLLNVCKARYVFAKTTFCFADGRCWSMGYHKNDVKVNFFDSTGDGILNAEGLTWNVDPKVFGFEGK